MNAKPSWSVDERQARLKAIKDRLESNDPQLKSVFTQTFLDREQDRAGHIDPKTEEVGVNFAEVASVGLVRELGIFGQDQDEYLEAGDLGLKRIFLVVVVWGRHKMQT